MTDKQYLEEVLKLQTLAPDSAELKALETHRVDVEKLLLQHFSESNPTIDYGGSIAKGTLIKEAYDLDVICYFEHEDTAAGDSLKDIYENAEAALQVNYLVERKTSALRLKSKAQDQLGLDFHIDVVPGRYTDDQKGDAYIYQASAEKCRLKTNLRTHVSFIKNSGVVDAIRLMKLWRERNGLRIKTFALELLTIELLKAKKTFSLADQLKHVWTVLKEEVDTISIEDPANPTGNDLSELLNPSVRQTLSLVATSTLNLMELNGWGSVFGAVKEADNAQRISSLKQAAATVTNPNRPWQSSE